MALMVLTRPESHDAAGVAAQRSSRPAEASRTGERDGGSTLVAMPVVVFFLLVQGRMTGGLVSGAVKG